jgi:predicted kinase
MQSQTLFLLMGYPGAGKTTVSRRLAELTGAIHLWADHERRQLFPQPTHSKAESDELYAKLDRETDKHLSERKSVIFDTNFNYYKDREYLRQIAKKHGAKTVLIWLTTPVAIAERRAVHEAHAKDTRVLGNMTHEDFKRIVSHLEPPHPDEHAIEIDGTDFDETKLASVLAIKP